MWCQIKSHSQLNSVLQEKYEIFPEICEKVSKINVFPQNEGLIPNKFSKYSFYGCIS